MSHLQQICHRHHIHTNPVSLTLFFRSSRLLVALPAPWKSREMIFPPQAVPAQTRKLLWPSLSLCLRPAHCDTFVVLESNLADSSLARETNDVVGNASIAFPAEVGLSGGAEIPDRGDVSDCDRVFRNRLARAASRAAFPTRSTPPRAEPRKGSRACGALLVMRGPARTPAGLRVSFSLLAILVANADLVLLARHGAGSSSRCCSRRSSSITRCSRKRFSASILFDSCSSSVMTAALSASSGVGAFAVYRRSIADAQLVESGRESTSLQGAGFSDAECWEYEFVGIAPAGAARVEELAPLWIESCDVRFARKAKTRCRRRDPSSFGSLCLEASRVGFHASCSSTIIISTRSPVLIVELGESFVLSGWSPSDKHSNLSADSVPTAPSYSPDFFVEVDTWVGEQPDSTEKTGLVALPGELLALGSATARTGVNALFHGATVLRSCSSARPASVGAAATHGDEPPGRRFGGIPGCQALLL